MSHHHHNHIHDDHDDHDEHDHSSDITPALQSNLYQQIDFDHIITFNEAESKSGAAIVRKTWAQRLDDKPELESDVDEQLLMYIPFVDPHSFLIHSYLFCPVHIWLVTIDATLFSTSRGRNHSLSTPPPPPSKNNKNEVTNAQPRPSFTGQIKLHSLLLYSPPIPSAPRTLKLFRNRHDLDFSTATDLTPTQTLSVPQTLTGPDSDVLEIPLNRAQFNNTTSITLFFEDNWSQGEEDVTRVSYVGFKGQHMALNREPVTFLYEAAANPRDHVAIQGVQGVGRTIGPGK
ncbi:hypothetical protein PAAG_00365 [Paracoccidioides lutzii Pb01]|uniref:PITH domain-containing protein n=1 Tax=Paracoccidioides lutzii (strain ATCC MYA-826 / Pb01) TaxID=502779 RepID=C1GPC0_PARBA|nr:hypothetical protein PAAG_00365 [Paracoccidioides lutzii Pb01]EEH36042.2 hypothetical protein PAAG_00365 [Paracoccidioides lutzii Pb01]